MTCIYMDGIETYQTRDIDLYFTSGGASGGAEIRTQQDQTIAIAAPSRQCLWINSNNVTVCRKQFGINYVSGLIGFRYRSSQSLVSKNSIMVVLDGVTEQISVRTNSSGVLTITRAGTVLATGTTVLTTNTWYYIEFKFTISNAAGIVELRLNGASEIAQVTGLDTTNTANVQWNGFTMGAQNQASAQAGYYDDFYVLNTAVSPNDDFLGPVSLVALYPSESGNYTQWQTNGGTNHGAVSDPFEDGDDTFNQSSTSTDKDSFAYQNLPEAAGGSVLAVRRILVAKKDAGIARSIRPLQRNAGSDFVGTSVALTTSYQAVQQVYDVSPATGLPWTIADVNGDEFGYELV